MLSDVEYWYLFPSLCSLHDRDGDWHRGSGCSKKRHGPVFGLFPSLFRPTEPRCPSRVVTPMLVPRRRHRPGRRLLLRAAVIPLLLALPSCGSEATIIEPDPEGLRILFIGNSLTDTNDLPGMLGWMLAQAEVAVGRIESVTFPNFGLEDHWGLSSTRGRISEGDFDVVVMQQGPSATEGRPSLLEYSQLFADEIVAAGGRPALYMVWPSRARVFDFDGVSDSYQTAAAQVGGVLFPAGEAWRAAWAQDPDLELYGGDGFHPSEMGTYLAALVMFEQLAETDPRTLPAVIPTSLGLVSITDEIAALLHQAAVDANAAFAR